MPFLKLEDQNDAEYWKRKGEEESPVVLLRQVSPNAFQLTRPFRYVVPGTDGKPYRIPQHNVGADPKNNSTDLATVPPFLWWFIASHGSHTSAALLHDDLVREGITREERKAADRVFLTALRESEVRWLRRWLMWTAVSLRTSFGRIGVVVILIHLIALATLTGYWAFGGRQWWPLGWLPESSFSEPWWPFGEDPFGGRPWLPALGLGVVGLAWGLRRWPLALVGFTLVILPTVFVQISLKTVQLVELIEEILLAIGGSDTRASGRPRTFELPAQAPFRQEQAPF